MRILQVFGFFVIFWQSNALTILNIFQRDFDIISRKCKNVDNTKLPLLRLKEQLFCDYDTSTHPYNFKNNVTVVILKLLPKLMELQNDHAILSLHSWMQLSWSDPHLTWTPSDHDGIDYIHVKNSEIWMPDLCVYNSGDMLDDQLELPTTECLLFSEGSISCVPAVKFVVKCDPDYTYFPYDKYQCRITFGSWKHTGLEVDYQISRDGINMNGYENNTMWDLKFINAVKEIKTHKCCPNDTFPSIDYNFLLTRYKGRKHITIVVPTIVLIFLTLTVLCLDPKSMERFALASVNFTCHLLCLYFIHWQLQYNGVNTPKIFIFYGQSVALATFAIILTILLRKLEDVNTEMPNWISSITMIILSNRIGRFLILKDSKIDIADENTETEANVNVPKSETKLKGSWKHFATIIDWLSFICVILTYIIMLIMFVPSSEI